MSGEDGIIKKGRAASIPKTVYDKIIIDVFIKNSDIFYGCSLNIRVSSWTLLVWNEAWSKWNLKCQVKMARLNKTEKTFSLKRLRNSENSQIKEICLDLHNLAHHHMATKRLALCFYDDIKVNKNRTCSKMTAMFATFLISPKISALRS